MLDQETMTTFITVAECQSFSQAAKLLHKSTATISYRIKILEEYVGVQLFFRTTRIVNLTASGEYLLEHCRQWHHWLSTMPSQLRLVNEGVEQEITIAINNLLYDPDVISNLLQYLSQRFPFTRINITRHVYMGVWDSLLSNKSDIAIGVPGSESLDSGVNTLFLGKIDWVFTVSNHHPLASIDSILSDEQLRAYPTINIEDTSQTLSKRTAWLLSGQREIKVPDMQTKILCHLKGTGIGFLPASVSKPYIQNQQLIEKTIKRPRRPSPLSLAWNGTQQGEVLKTIIKLFKLQDPIIKPLLDLVEPNGK
ncbi:LysR family transcriptional activator of the allD operon [Providencia alcalifaciens]|nr:LysR family transcriptional activator of the allD operon [Providencia alcalifaciens]